MSKKCDCSLWLEYVGHIHCTLPRKHDGACVYGLSMARAGEIEDAITHDWREVSKARAVLVDVRKVLDKASV